MISSGYRTDYRIYPFQRNNQGGRPCHHRRRKNRQANPVRKSPGRHRRIAASQHIPVIAITGQVETDTETDKQLLQAGLSAIFPIHPAPVSLEEAMHPDYAFRNIRRTIEQTCRTLLIFVNKKVINTDHKI